MKKWVLFIIVIAGINLQKTFGQTFPWADSAISYMEASNGPYGYAICTDDSDNIFVTGYQDIDNIFSLKKYNTSGLLKWNKTGLVNYGVATDNLGNCYTT